MLGLGHTNSALHYILEVRDSNTNAIYRNTILCVYVCVHNYKNVILCICTCTCTCRSSSITLHDVHKPVHVYIMCILCSYTYTHTQIILTVLLILTVHASTFMLNFTMYVSTCIHSFLKITVVSICKVLWNPLKGLCLEKSGE